ncbi:hypothetical protein CDV57_09724, partial [Aspergillus fumigatus]
TLWLEAAECMARGDSHPTFRIGSGEQNRELAPMLESRATLLLDWANDAELWEDDVIVALLMGCTRQSDAPLLIVSEGRAVTTENCESPSADNQTTCRGFFCEIALHQQGVLPAYASVQQSRHQYNFSDQPGKSIYLANYET